MERISGRLAGFTLTLTDLAGEQLTIGVIYDAGWGQMNLDAWFWPEDFIDFMIQLDVLYKSLQGKAVLRPKYGSDCVLTLTVNGLGHIKGEIHLEYEDDSFDGIFQCDQSYLPGFLSSCQRMWAQLEVSN